MRSAYATLLDPQTNNSNTNESNATASVPIKNSNGLVFPLTPMQLEALRLLSKFGLTKDDLFRWEGVILAGGGDFCEDHLNALIHLIQIKRVSPQMAINEINETLPEEARCIAAGFTRAEVRAMKMRPPQLAAFLEFRADGLTPACIKKFNQSDWLGISYEHVDALRYLIREKQLTPDDAMKYIDDLNKEQAGGVAAGLSKEEVYDLHAGKIAVLIEFKRNGLTGDDLRNCSRKLFYSAFFDNNCIEKQTLYYLTHLRYFSPQAALAEMEGLESFQLEALMEGRSREEAQKITVDQIAWPRRR